MAESRVGLSARVRQWAIGRIRRTRLLPVGMPDKRTDEHRLGVPFRGRVLVYFPNGADALYQLRPWLPTLKALDAEQGVVAVFKDSRTAAVVRHHQIHVERPGPPVLLADPLRGVLEFVRAAQPPVRVERRIISQHNGIEERTLLHSAPRVGLVHR